MCVELGVKKVADSVGRERCRRDGGVRGGGRNRSAYFYASRCAAGELSSNAARPGAHVTLVDGLISDCGKIVASRKDQEGWFDVRRSKSRIASKARKRWATRSPSSSGWQLPDVIFYPCGGGVGLIGMWKSFAEMEALGWISEAPKMIAVQAEGCAPIVKAFEEGKTKSEFFEHAETVASGLRVPKALGDFLVLDAVRQSGGTCIAVSDAEMIEAAVELATDEGIFAAPEGGACVAALKKLLGERIS